MQSVSVRRMDSKRAVAVMSELQKQQHVGNISSVLWKDVLCFGASRDTKGATG